MSEQDNQTDGSTINRTSRANQTREKQAVRKPWAPPSMLDAPPAPTALSIVGFAPKRVVLMIRRTSVPRCAKVGNWSVRTSILILKRQLSIQVNIKVCLELADCFSLGFPRRRLRKGHNTSTKEVVTRCKLSIRI
jgi:hypothetical protein